MKNKRLLTEEERGIFSAQLKQLSPGQLDRCLDKSKQIRKKNSFHAFIAGLCIALNLAVGITNAIFSPSRFYLPILSMAIVFYLYYFTYRRSIFVEGAMMEAIDIVKDEISERKTSKQSA